MLKANWKALPAECMITREGGGWGAGGSMSYQTGKKTIDFCKKDPFSLVSCFYYHFCCFDRKKNKLSVCTKDESSYICRFDILPYHHH